MDATELGLTWAAGVIGAAGTVLGIVWLATRADARRSGWFKVLIGPSILLNAVPRVAGASDAVVLGFTAAGLVVASIAIVALFWAPAARGA